MREIKVEQLDRHFSIKFNVINNWFLTNIDPLNKSVVDFLKINEKFPIGPLRDAGYVDLMIEKIRAAGMYEKFHNETSKIIEEGTKLWNDYDTYLNNLGKRNAQICNAANAVVDEKSLAYFKHVYETNEELSNVPGYTTRPTLHWLHEQVINHVFSPFSDGKFTREEVLELVEQAIRRP